MQRKRRRRRRAKRLNLKRCNQPGDATKYISHRQIKPGERVVLACRASNIEQDRDASLKRHHDWIYQQMLDCGAVIVGKVAIVASGYNPSWVCRAAAIAKQHGAVIVAHSTDRFVRPRGYDKTNQTVPTIDCYFHEGELTKTEILEQQLIENLLRTDLRPMEEARAYQQLIKLNGWTGKQLAAAIHIHASTVTRALALLKLPSDIQQLVETEKINPSLAYELTKLPSPEQQRATLQQHQQQPMTAKKARRQVRQRQGNPNTRQRGVKQTFLTEEGWKITVALERKANYDSLKQALQEALDEVQLRIDNSVVLS